jgi:cytoskeleton protein RodZ
MPPIATPGGLIAAAMQARGLSVEDLAHATRLRPGLIEQMTQDDFVDTGGDVYARGHLRTICTVLSLDSDEVLASYDSCLDIHRPPAP